MTPSKVRHWTLDNAANNGTFMEELEKILELQDIKFDAQDRHIMCFPHVINICSQHVIKKFTNTEFVDAPKEEIQVSEPPATESYEDAVKADPIAHG
jgi:hypothetical protein